MICSAEFEMQEQGWRKTTGMIIQNSRAVVKNNSVQTLQNANKQHCLMDFSFPLPENESNKEEFILPRDPRSGGK